MELLPVPPPLLDLLRALRDAGGRPYVVGGAVRDFRLGLPVKDWDVECYGLPASTLRETLAKAARVELVGESFGVFKVAGLPGAGEVDVSLPRRDSKTGVGHRGFSIEGDPDLPIEEAARRRDFTINAMLADPFSGELIDPFHGAEDLDRRLLRVVDAETFGDDSLRVLRGAQLAARFELAATPETHRICSGVSLVDLPAERISGEIEKLLLRAAKPSIGFRLLLGWGRLGEVAPELLPTIGCPQEPKWHPEGDVFTHTMQAIDLIGSVTSGEPWGDLDLPRTWAVALGILAHDLGKPATTVRRDDRWRSPDHEGAGIPPTESLLDRWNVRTRDGYDVRAQVLGLVGNHLKPGQFHDAQAELRDSAFRRLARKCELDLLARVASADSRGRNGAFDDREQLWFRAKARELEVAAKPPEPILMGRHLLELGMKPGPEIGKLLAAIYDRQLEGEITTLEAAVDAARRESIRT